jgi:hypothetical protein
VWRVSLLFVGACSFAFMPPPSSVGGRACSNGFEAPVTDTVIGGAALVLASTVAIATALHPEGSYPANATLYVTVPAALLFSSSAVYGYLSRHHCEQVKAEYQRERAMARTTQLQGGVQFGKKLP